MCLGLAVVGSTTTSKGVVFNSGPAGVIFRGDGVVLGFFSFFVFGFLVETGFLGALVGFLVEVGFLGALVGFWGFRVVLGASGSSDAGVVSSGLSGVSSSGTVTLGATVVFRVVIWGDVVGFTCVVALASDSVVSSGLIVVLGATVVVLGGSLSVVFSLAAVVISGLLTSGVLVGGTVGSLELFSRAFGVGASGNSGVTSAGVLGVVDAGSLEVVGAGSLGVVGSGSLGVVGAGSLGVGSGFWGVVGVGSLVVVTGFLVVVGAGSFVVVGTGFLVVVGAEFSEVVGVGDVGATSLSSALRISFAEVVFSFLLAEVCLFVAVVSFVSTTVSVLEAEDASLDVSELGARLGLALAGFAAVVLGDGVVGLSGAGVSLGSPLSCPLPASSTTGGSGLGSFLAGGFLLSFSREENKSYFEHFFSL